jgi:uncharacterized protein (TIGR02246 family)
MRWRGVGAVAVGLILVAVGAVGLQAQEAQGPPIQPSVELPPELERVLRDYETGWSTGDAEGLAGLFVEEGLIVRGGTWIRGRDAIQRAYQGAGGPLRLRAVEFAADGDVGFIVGAYGYGDELRTPDRGLFTLTLKREGGRWLIVSDMDRSGG